MKAATLVPKATARPLAPITIPQVAIEEPNRLADYIALAKPRIATLVLFTVAAGVLLADAGQLPLLLLFHAVLGTALVATGASALNQWLERHSDALMRRTANRPLPAGRLSPLEVFLFGSLCGVVGFVYLLWMIPTPCAALLAAFTFFSYVCIYTPLKSRTTINTLVGAVPGAMPPVIGWCAVTGEITPGALSLFAILFLWQVPHFLAIAWMYLSEYARAGLKMLPVMDPDGQMTARHMVLYCLALVAFSLAPALLGAGGLLYIAGALLLGAFFVRSTLRFRANHSIEQARSVLRASLLYLPGLLLVLVIDRTLTALIVG